MTTTDREALTALPGDDYDTVVDFLTDSTLSDPPTTGSSGRNVVTASSPDPVVVGDSVSVVVVESPS